MSHGSYCIVKDCFHNKREYNQYAFFTLPKRVEVAREWIIFSGRDDLLVSDEYLKKDYRVCSAHFLSEQFVRVYPRKVLKPNSFPCVKKGKGDSWSNKTHDEPNSEDKDLEHDTPTVNIEELDEMSEESSIPSSSKQNDSTKRQEVVPSQEFSNREDRSLQSTKETSEKQPDALIVTTVQQQAFVSENLASESEEPPDAFDSTIVPDQDVESERVEILAEKQHDAFDEMTERHQALKSNDATSKVGTFFSEFGDDLKCRTCMQITYDGLPLDSPCFTTRSMKDAIVQLLPELVPYLKDEDVICPNCVNEFNTILKFLENCLRVNNTLARLADKKDSDTVVGEQNKQKASVLEDDSFDNVFEDGEISMDIEKPDGYVSKTIRIKPPPRKCFIYSTFLTVPIYDSIVSFNRLELRRSHEIAQTLTDLGIRVEDKSKGNGKKRIVLIGNNNIWMCPLCRMAYRLESELHQHAAEAHKLVKTHLLTPKLYFNENSSNGKKRRVFNCPYCDESVPMNSLAEHTASKHGDPKPFKCFSCRKSFESYKCYKRHNNFLYSRLPSYTTVCKICDKRINRTIYKEHFDSHKTFQCESCSKCFTNMTSLLTHQAAHKGESRLCPFCGKTFTIQGLHIHIQRIHVEQTKRDLLCHICSKTFCTKKDLARHIGSVHDAKLVDCKICGKIFKSDLTLRHHLRCKVCSIKYGCPFCKREFMRKNMLKVHMIKNHNSTNISESRIIRRRIRSDGIGECENTKNPPNIVVDNLDVEMNKENES